MQIKRSSIFATLIGIVVFSTVFFHYAEGWNWLDSLFFTVVTISTVGYGNFVPVTAAGKIGRSWPECLAHSPTRYSPALSRPSKASRSRPGGSPGLSLWSSGLGGSLGLS